MKKILALMVSFAAFLGCNGQAAYKSVDVAAFAEVISNSDVQLVDARTASEYAEGHIPGAVNIDVKSGDFDKQIATLDASRPVAVYCRSGRRSKAAAARLSKAGYEVIELNSGILSWPGKLETR